jgi:SagB-type dehydrogenase family enzyme
LDTHFADLSPAAWTFHRHSSRWAHNALMPSLDDIPEPGKELLDAPWTPLPTPRTLSGGLAEMIVARRSCRNFAEAAAELADLSDLLHWSYGVLADDDVGQTGLPHRPVPSGGAMYGLEVYVLARRVEGLAGGVYHYQPAGHGLEALRDVVPPHPLATYLFMGQPYAADAAMVVVVTAVFRRAMKKYRDRGYRYLLLEAGHVGQNLSLCAASLRLGACALGGFFDAELAQLLRVDLARELPLSAMALGPPRPLGAGDPGA